MSPVAGALVAAAVRKIDREEGVQAAQRLRQSLGPAALVILQQEEGAHNVGEYPWVPVVDLARGEAHPPEVLPFQEGDEDPLVHFPSDTLPKHRAQRIQLLLQQVGRPGEQRGRFGSEEVNDRIVHIRKSIALALKGKRHMGGDDPGRFLA
ncbi:hypothetical protein N6H14_04940 [Paenibacillus sp. CC-CFT747]|nr:hypothetical protein N6H14_04940 [Paenibacillus sp. CC-CFT747]